MRSTTSRTTGAPGRRTARARAATVSLALAAAVASGLVAGPGLPGAGPLAGPPTSTPPTSTPPTSTPPTSTPPTGATRAGATGAGPSSAPAEGRAVHDGPRGPVAHRADGPGEQPAGTARPAPDRDRPASSPSAPSAPSAPSGTAGPGTTARQPGTPAPSGPGATAPVGARPAAPAPGVVTGTLTRAWAEARLAAEHDDHGTGHGTDPDAAPVPDQGAELLAWVEAGAAAYPVTPADVRSLEDGSLVTLDLGAAPAGGTHPADVLGASGPVAAAGELLYGQGSQDVFGAAAEAAVHDVTVVLAVPSGATRDSTTPAALAAAVDGGVRTYWSQQTRGQRTFRVVAAHGWQQLSVTCADPAALWREVASKVGFVAGTRRHLVVYIPRSSGCGAGLGTVGSPDAGGRSWVGLVDTSIIAHELGHNMGLGHSGGLLCATTSDGRWSGGAWQAGCATHEYRDYYDVMGISWSTLGSLAAPQADALGVLRSTDKLVTSGPVRIRLVPASSDGVRVLRIDDPGGAYYVEYRTPTGWDSWLSTNRVGLDAGVLVHRAHPGRAREVLLLDGSVSGGTRSSDWASALRAGTSMTTASGATRVVVEEVGSSGATVAVWRDGVGPASTPPPADGSQVEIQEPRTTSLVAGTTVFSGVATAPEGTLHWEVLQDGVVQGSGLAQTGANGRFETFQVPVALPEGTFVVRVTVPDYSDGEGGAGPGTVDEVTVTVGPS